MKTQSSWNNFGKLKSFENFLSNIRLEFNYDPMGNRIEKRYFPDASNRNHYISDFYVRDAQGNIMATYKYEYDFPNSLNRLDLEEFHMYGSSRIGTIQLGFNLYDNDPNPSWTEPITNLRAGHKRYELTNHLGNVMAVVNDRTQGIHADADGIIDYYEATVLKANDYYPFGSYLPDREYTFDDYRFSFNGQERDDEVSGEGNSLSFKYRIEDSRLGRFFSVDPLAIEYPMYTSYGFAANQPIHAGDLEGLENPSDKNPTCFVVPMSPEDVDPNIWTPVPYRTGHDQGHTLRWYDKDGNMLAYDGPMSDRKIPEKPSTKEGWHMYNSNKQRYGADGGVAGFDDSNGNRVYNKNQNGGPGDGHLTSGQKTQIKVGGASGIMQKLNSFAFFLNFGSLILDSPNSLLYTYHQIGTCSENRAYPVTGTGSVSLYYEWKWTDASKTLRQVTTFYNYEYKNNQWRGTDPTGNVQFFDNEGNEIKLY